MNTELINRYNTIVKYYDKDFNIYPRYRGYYDFLILKQYLSSFENFLFTEIDKENKIHYWYINKDILFTVINSNIYVNKKGINLSCYQIELSEFISKYDKDFSEKYKNILKDIKYPYAKRLIMIYLNRCSFCDNPDKEETFIIENLYTRNGYQYCKFCERFAKYSFTKIKIKRALHKFKLYTKVIGKLLLIYHTKLSPSSPSL
jgi:hypothetical protein